MRILLVTTSYPLDSESVSGIFVARLAKQLQGKHAVKVLVPGDRNRRTRACSRDGVSILPYRYAPRSWQCLAHSPGGIPVALKRNPWLYLLVPGFLTAMFFGSLKGGRRADVIHANWAICGLVAGMAGKLLGVPVVVSLRGEDVTRGLRKPVDRWILKRCLGVCSRVVGVSDAIVRQLREEFPAQMEKYRLVENGVEDRFLAVQRKWSNDGELRLIAVGSLIPRKGVDVLVNALASVPGARLTLVGDGPEREHLEQLVRRLDLGDRVRFEGWLEPDAILEQLMLHDVLVLASHAEGRPNVVLEAMASAMPVVASNIDGVDELVEHERTGLLFTPGESGELAGLLGRLATNRDMLPAMGKAGRERIVAMGLVWEQTAARYEEVYAEARRGSN